MPPNRMVSARQNLPVLHGQCALDRTCHLFHRRLLGQLLIKQRAVEEQAHQCRDNGDDNNKLEEVKPRSEAWDWGLRAEC